MGSPVWYRRFRNKRKRRLKRMGLWPNEQQEKRFLELVLPAPILLGEVKIIPMKRQQEGN